MRGEKPAENELKRSILDDWPWVEPTYTVSIPAAAKSIKTIAIDPTGRMADVDQSNNIFDMSNLFE